MCCKNIFFNFKKYKFCNNPSFSSMIDIKENADNVLYMFAFYSLRI